MELANKLFKGDRVIWIVFMFLCAVSIVEVFSATSTLAYKQPYFWKPIWRHISFMITGAGCMLLLSQVNYKKIGKMLVLLFPVAIVLLVVTLILAQEVNGAKRWIFGIQPSEVAKLTTIGFVAFVLSKQGKLPEKQIYRVVLTGVLVSCAFILPENFSTAFLLFGVCFLMMFIGQIAIKRLAKLAGCLLLLLVLFVTLIVVLPDNVIKYLPRVPTWKERISDFTHSSSEVDEGTYVINDDNYQVSHAKIAIARGGLFGRLPGHGQQRDFLPQAYSDFIYAIIIEELGFVLGGVGVLFLYIILLVRVGMIARKCTSSFAKFLVLGCGLLVVMQALANMAVAVDLIPVTGQPMPLVSRGGTSTIISCIYFGIILSVSRFGAGMGDEEEEESEEEPLNPDTPEMETSELNELTTKQI
ncbi:MAG: FtsW/RodA/SpoVE family cell cycle protein [Parabacteroides sp.]